uniref:Uncharacterized protein n=1 Tax=Steinernema glaseri TaxID=37863 RepID=A0A1I7Y5P4_9BILA
MGCRGVDGREAPTGLAFMHSSSGAIAVPGMHSMHCLGCTRVKGFQGRLSIAGSICEYVLLWHLALYKPFLIQLLITDRRPLGNRRALWDRRLSFPYLRFP